MAILKCIDTLKIKEIYIKKQIIIIKMHYCILLQFVNYWPNYKFKDWSLRINWPDYLFFKKIVEEGSFNSFK